MLILMFRDKDDVVITLPDGSEIVVQLMSIDRNRARIGFTAAPEIVIDRRVIYERKRVEVAR